MQSGGGSHGQAACERTHGQGGDVRRLAQRRVGRIEHLESPVQPKAVHEVGAHPAADLIGGFEQQHLASGGFQGAGRGEPGQAGTDDQHVSFHESLLAWSDTLARR